MKNLTNLAALSEEVEVFVGRQRQRRGYDNSSPNFRHGELKLMFFCNGTNYHKENRRNVM